MPFRGRMHAGSHRSREIGEQRRRHRELGTLHMPALYKAITGQYMGPTTLSWFLAGNKMHSRGRPTGVLVNVLVDGGYFGCVSDDGALDSAVPLHCIARFV